MLWREHTHCQIIANAAEYHTPVGCFRNHIPLLLDEAKPLIRERGHIRTTQPSQTSTKRMVPSSHGTHGTPGFVTWWAATTARIPLASGRFSGTCQVNDDGSIQINQLSSEAVKYHLHIRLPVHSEHNSQAMDLSLTHRTLATDIAPWTVSIFQTSTPSSFPVTGF